MRYNIVRSNYCSAGHSAHEKGTIYVATSDLNEAFRLRQQYTNIYTKFGGCLDCEMEIKIKE